MEYKVCKVFLDSRAFLIMVARPIYCYVHVLLYDWRKMNFAHSQFSILADIPTLCHYSKVVQPRPVNEVKSMLNTLKVTKSKLHFFFYASKATLTKIIFIHTADLQYT